MDNQKELREAISAGERALFSLRAAQDQLRRAGNWGVADLLGGGMLTAFLKHQRLGEAEQSLQIAQNDLRRFQNELRDIDQMADLDISDFLAFADYFFDGIVADLMVQSKIRQARERVDMTILRVETLVRQLRSRR